MNEEVMFQAQLLQEEAQKVQNQLEAVEQQLHELTEFNTHLSILDKTQEKEMLSSMGKGIYAKTTLVDKNLYLEVGAGVIVKKTPLEVIKVVEDQIKKLGQMRVHLLGQKEVCSRTMQELLNELKSQNPKHNHSKEKDN